MFQGLFNNKDHDYDHEYKNTKLLVISARVYIIKFFYLNLFFFVVVFYFINNK
jgi:hypothetical protein